MRRASPVLRDLLAHRDYRVPKARKVLLDHLALRPQLKAPYALCAPTARRQLAEGSATKVRCLW